MQMAVSELRVSVSAGRLLGLKHGARDDSAPHKEGFMPSVTIVLKEGRTVEQKRELVKAVTEAIVRTVNAKPEAVHIVIHDAPACNIGSGGQLLADK
jgi:4-oxalocrotonate tautomerase